MPRNGSGVEIKLAVSIANPNTTVESAPYNAQIDDLVDCANDTLLLNGVKPMTGPLAMGTQKITGLAVGTALTDAPTLGQVQSGVAGHSTAVAGTVDAIQVTMSPAITTWATNELISWKSGGANTITAPTISKDAGGTTKIIKKGASAALSVGDLGASGYEHFGRYNGTDLILLNPVSAAGGSITASGYTMNTDRLLGRDTAAAGAIEELTLGAGLAISGGALTVSAGATNIQTFTSSGTWTKPASGTMALLRAWGAGGSGGKGRATSAGGGGGGGGYVERWLAVASMGATETITLNAGGASQTVADSSGNAGGTTTIGTLLTAYGGGGGRGTDTTGQNPGGGGGGWFEAGATPTATTGGKSGAFKSNATIATGGSAMNGRGGDAGVGAAGDDGNHGYFEGGGGGGPSDGSTLTNGNGGNSFMGGGGGGAGAEDSAPGAGTGGVSLHGGNGGAGAFDANNATAGTAPGGGGGGSETGNSGAGAIGRVEIYVFP